MAEAAITGAIAQQAVQRARLFRQPCDVRFGREPISNEPAARNPHRLRQSRCRLASRRGQTNDGGRGGVLEQEQQHARDRRRLSRTRPARDDGELAVEGTRDGNALPVRPIVARKERGDAGRERLQIGFAQQACPRAFQQRRREQLFVAVKAGQVEARAFQHQRRRPIRRSKQSGTLQRTAKRVPGRPAVCGIELKELDAAVLPPELHGQVHAEADHPGPLLLGEPGVRPPTERAAELRVQIAEVETSVVHDASAPESSLASPPQKIASRPSSSGVGGTSI